MKKILTILILILTFSLTNVNAVSFDITSDNVILYNLDDNKILYEKDSEEKVQIASLTKIMTVLVAIENIDDLEEKVTITKEAFNDIKGYSQVGLEVGDKVTYKDLLYGAMLPSGADAVNALVLNVCPNKDEFITLMNKKAKALSLNDTKFDNAIGKDSDNNYSTAKDLSKLLMHALENETFKTIYTTKKYTIPSLDLDLKSTLLYYGSNIDVSAIKGSKSGFTDEAGVCLSSIATLNDINYMLIVLGADTSSKSNAVKDSLTIYGYYNKNYSYKQIIKYGEILDTIDIKWGKVDTYEIKSPKEIKLYLKNSISKEEIEYTYEGIEELNYKNKKGDKLGVVTLTHKEETLTSFDVYLNDTIEYYHPVIYTIMISAIILMIISIILMKKQKRNHKTKKRKK